MTHQSGAESNDAKYVQNQELGVNTDTDQCNTEKNTDGAVDAANISFHD